MLTLKTQIEIRYQPILDFRNLYRKLVNPFIKDSKIEFGKLNTQEEFIIIKFPEEGYLIDIRWDRIVYACDGKKDNFYTANGPLFSFFTLFDKLKAIEEFGEVKNILVAQWDLIEYEKKEETILNSFKSKYFSNLPLVEGYQDDLAVMIDFNAKEDIIKLQFGPYNEKKDVEAFNLLPISAENQFLLRKKGILIQTIATEMLSFVDLNSFKKIDRKIQSITSQISL